MTAVIQVENLTRRYRHFTALDDVSFTVEQNTITGLLGRNGAGKTTLMRLLTGQEFRTTGSISIFGANPTENDEVLRRMILIKESQVYPDLKFKRILEAASWFHPHWDAEFAASLVEEFSLPLNRAVKKFSRGMKSAAGIVLGLASRAEITFFDEPYLGLDATSRQIFYDRLLADYAEHPRTVVLSTHLIDEVANLLENVLVIDQGRITMAAPVEDLRGKAVTISGSERRVGQFVAGHKVWHTQTVGGRSATTIEGPVTELDRERARDLDLDIESISLQQLVVRSAALSDPQHSQKVSA